MTPLEITKEENLESEVHSRIKTILSYEILAEKKVITKLERDLRVNDELKNIYTAAKSLSQINCLLKEETVRKMVFLNVELKGEKYCLIEWLHDTWQNYDENPQIENINLDDNFLSKICASTFKFIMSYLKNKNYFGKSKGFGQSKSKR
ncbi:MAG: hypothetical protein QNJ54_27895 [Prochloraceae cyanobacterium]|nr:hypothetical protein [Prochloraceae cyanobacterium]